MPSSWDVKVSKSYKLTLTCVLVAFHAAQFMTHPITRIVRCCVAYLLSQSTPVQSEYVRWDVGSINDLIFLYLDPSSCLQCRIVPLTTAMKCGRECPALSDKTFYLSLLESYHMPR